MNPVELAAQKIVVTTLTELHDHRQAALKLVTLNKLADGQLAAIQSKIDACLKVIKHFVDVADGLIPAGIPILKDVFDWAKAMLDALEPEN
jgi:hypothetical protein